MVDLLRELVGIESVNLAYPGGVGEGVPRYAQQVGLEERLLEQGRAGLQHAVVPDDVVGVAGHVQNLYVGPHSRQFFCDLRPTHLRHRDIRQQQMNRAQMLRAGQKRFDAVRSNLRYSMLMGLTSADSVAGAVA